MGTNIKYIFLIFSIVFFGHVLSFADNDETKAYKTEEIKLRSFDNKQWEGLSEKMVYSKKNKPKKVKKEKVISTDNIPPVPVNNNTPVAQFLLIFIAVLLLSYVVYKVVAGDAILVNQGVERKKITSVKDIEKNLTNADVDSFLQKSLSEEDYRLSIRLYYLSIIKKLSQKNIIEWKKDKTNGQYMREMRAVKHPLFNDFRNVTRVFEYVWYSNMVFDKGQFMEVSIDFKDFLKAIN